MRLRREEKITLKFLKDNSYMVENSKGELVFSHDDNYFIYFKNVNFKDDGVIEGRYLGVTDGVMIDGQSVIVDYDGVRFNVDGKTVKTARLVAINNKDKTVIIIQNK